MTLMKNFGISGDHENFKKYIVEMTTKMLGNPEESDLQIVNEIMDETYMNTLVLVENELYKKFPGNRIIKEVLDALKEKV